MEHHATGSAGLPWPLGVPVLGDGVVTLRAATPADVGPTLEMSHDDEMQRWTSVPVGQSQGATEHFLLVHGPEQWTTGAARCWVLEAEDDDGRPRFAGTLDLRGPGAITNVGYALHPWARGRGLMTRAVRLAVDHAFNEGGVEAVHWSAHVGNVASLRVAHACGFELVGTTPAMLHERGRVLDAWTAVLRFGDAPVPRSRWLDAPVVETGTVRLRPFVDRDVPRLVEACSDPATQHWINTIVSPYTPDDAQDFLSRAAWDAAAGRTLTWALADSTTDDLLGTIHVMNLGGSNPATGELGYWAHPDARGRGVMTSAVRAAVRHAFDVEGLGLSRLSLRTAAGNAASRAVASKAGFTAVGVERQAELLGDGSVDDLVTHDLLATDRPAPPA